MFLTFRSCHTDGDVSGMPDPYMEHYEQGAAEMNPENKPQISFDESLESGYSTPNSRNRRIIREIIVWGLKCRLQNIFFPSQVILYTWNVKNKDALSIRLSGDV